MRLLLTLEIDGDPTPYTDYGYTKIDGTVVPDVVHAPNDSEFIEKVKNALEEFGYGFEVQTHLYNYFDLPHEREWVSQIEVSPQHVRWTVTQLLQNSIDFWPQTGYIIGMSKERNVLTSARDRMKKDLPPVVSEQELLEGVGQLAKSWGLDRNYTKVTQPLSFKNVS